jgi:hypothetical protein
MTYRVAFTKRFQSDGQESAIDPTGDLDVLLPDGVVVDKAFVERFEPEAKHSQEVLDEDDAFLGMAAAEVWDYDVVDERRQEFEDAMASSEVVMEFHVVDETSIEEDDVVGAALASGKETGELQMEDTEPVTRGGSGVQATDDGPGGQPTGDSSAGETTRGSSTRLEEGLGDLEVMEAEDPRLGLTNVGRVGPDDWAADTGPDRDADHGVETQYQTDRRSTLRPGRK